MAAQRNVVITGANTGIGLETAVALATRGDRVVVACRNQVKGTAALEEIRRRSGGDAELVALDLSSFDSIRAAAAELAVVSPVIDVLINNAGGILSRRQTTTEGFEMQFGVNHLGHFLLTTLLEPQIKAAEAPRVVVLSSVGHHGAIGGLRWDDLQSERRYNGWMVYCRTKLANLLFARELAERWKGDGVVVHAVHPGSVHTEFGQAGDTTGFSALLMKGSGLVSITPAEGALTSVHVATSPEAAATTGLYWTKCKPARTSRAARRPGGGPLLWRISEAYVAEGHP
jgi:retinol dehydrogenase-14